MSAVLKLATVNGAAVTEKHSIEQPRKRMQDGFVAMPNGVMQGLKRLKGLHQTALLAVIEKTIGFQKLRDELSNSQVATEWGCDRERVGAAITDLIEAGILTCHGNGRYGRILSVSDVENWGEVSCGKKPQRLTQKAAPNAAKSRLDSRKKPHSTDNPQQTKEEPNGSMSSTDDDGRKKTASRGRTAPAPVDAVIALYNEVLGARLPKAVASNASRGGSIRARWREMLNSKTPSGTIRYQDEASGLAWWKRFFAKVTLNPHWMGSNDNGWTASLDWIIGPKNFLKVLEYRPAKREVSHD